MDSPPQAPLKLPPRLLLACRTCIGYEESGRLELLADEYTDKAGVENLAAELGVEIRFRMTDSATLERAMAAMSENAVAEEAKSVGILPLKEASTPYFSGIRQHYVENLVARALAEGASDIHIQPGPENCRLRLRIDGRLRDIEELPSAAAAPLAAQIKVLARLPLSEKRLPHDGRLRVQAEGRNVDLRVSILPSIYGEALVLRLESGDAPSTLDRLGMPEAIHTHVQRLLERREGLFLTGGPTGSGKTTTLYAMMRALGDSRRKLISVEDPVERILPGVGQVPVEDGGMDFGTAIRAMLRHAPDAIMIGEIRDAATASAATEAALTGHMVLASVHARDAAEAVVRMIDLGVSRNAVACVLEAALTQRLLRRLCPACSEEAVIPPPLARALSIEEPVQVRTRNPSGCTECSGGFTGRSALFAMTVVNVEMREAIARGAGARALRRMAAEFGMPSLGDAARTCVLRGQVDAAEALACIGQDGTLAEDSARQ